MTAEPDIDKRRLMLSLQACILDESYQSLSGIPKEKRSEAACICVAKDESPYIHEYIHHHLYFGFSYVLVLVNRTTDTTTQVLDAIISRHPNVSYLTCDWIDEIGLGQYIQLIALACGIAHVRKLPNIRYAAVTDIDEFWFPVDFKTNVLTYLEHLGWPAQISFCWLQQFVKEPSFRPPFETACGQHSNIIKSFVDVTTSIQAMYSHRALLPPEYSHVTANGVKYLHLDGLPMKSALPLQGHSAYILHRLQRSEDEYIASLLRGRPGKPGAIKDNRKGYLDLAPSFSSCLPAPLIMAYHESLQRFVDSCGLAELLERARAARLCKAAQIESILSSLNCDSDIKILAKVLKGTIYQNRFTGTAAGEL